MRRHSRASGPLRLFALLAVSSLAGVACSPDGPVALQTYHMAGAACGALPARGVLVADPIWGLALAGTDDSGAPHRFGVVWPDVYSARRDRGTVILLEASGNVVAREGDHVVLDSPRGDPLHACDIEVVQN